MNETFKTFAKELAYYEAETNSEKWVLFLQDLANYADYHWDIPQMQYDLVKSDAEWKEFLSHPERQPYKIKAINWHKLSLSEIYEKTLDIVQATLFMVSNKKLSTAYRTKLALPLSAIVKGIVHSRYEIEEMRIGDDSAGISAEDRSLARLEVNTVQMARFNYITDMIALQKNLSVTEIRKKFLAVCGGDLARLSEFFATCQFSDEIKDLFTAYRNIAGSNKTGGDFNIIFGFKVWQELVAHGITLNVYMDILGYPNAKKVKTKLLDLLHNRESNAEIVEFFKRERPQSYKIWEKNGSIPMIDISQEEAVLYDFSKKLRSLTETNAMINRSRKTITEYFPLSKNENPRYIMFNPTHPFAVGRAYQSHTYNAEKRSVNIVVMTPTSDSEHDYLETLAHETTHAIHSQILKRAADCGILTNEQADQVPTGVLEEFSQLVDSQFRIAPKKQQKTYTGTYFTSFTQALGSRWQAPFGLVQIEIRERFEQWIKNGVTEITQEMLNVLRFEFDTKMKDWWERELHFTRPGLSALSWFMPLAPYDALVYMKRFIVPSKTSKVITSSKKKELSLSMNAAFAKRFGKAWIKSPDARTILYWLLLETGRNHATEHYGDIILKKDVTECLVELQRINIGKDEFREIVKKR